jgi:CRP-like cAMP-binding protein
MEDRADGVRWKLFEDLDDRAYDDVRAMADRVVRKAKGDKYFVRQGDTGDFVFFIEAGHVGVYVTPPNRSRARMIRVLGPGDHFGELAVLGPDRSKKRMADVVALDKEVIAWRLSRDEVDDLRKRAEVEKALLSALAKEVARLSQEVVYAFQKGVPERVARKLVYLAEVYGERGQEEVKIPLTQRELADMCGLDRPTVGKELPELRRGNFISPPENSQRKVSRITINVDQRARLKERAMLPAMESQAIET